MDEQKQVTKGQGDKVKKASKVVKKTKKASVTKAEDVGDANVSAQNKSENDPDRKQSSKDAVDAQDLEVVKIEPVPKLAEAEDVKVATVTLIEQVETPLEDTSKTDHEKHGETLTAEGGERSQRNSVDILTETLPPVDGEALPNITLEDSLEALRRSATVESDVIKMINEDVLKEFEEMFELMDFNKDGLITHADLKKVFTSLGLDVSDRDVTAMLAEGPKPLDYEGFVNLLGSRAIQMDPEDILMDALSKWDYDESGYISLSRICEDLINLGDRFTQEEVKFALEKANVLKIDGIKMLEYPLFCQFLGGMRKKDV